MLFAPTSILRWRDGEILDGHVDPFIAFFDQHDRDVVLDGILAAAIRLLTDKPSLGMKFEQALLLAYTGRAAQDFKQIFADHCSLQNGVFPRCGMNILEGSGDVNMS